MDPLIPPPRTFPALSGGAPSLPMSLYQELPHLFSLSTMSLSLNSFFSSASDLCPSHIQVSDVDVLLLLHSLFVSNRAGRLQPSTAFPAALLVLLCLALLVAWSLSLHLRYFSFPLATSQPGPAGKHLHKSRRAGFLQDEPDAF